jgi:CheY-like chemotaxis protein
MVLAAVDDLLFSSKIRATARAAGVDVTFARSRIDVLAQARLLQPALIVFDLNSPKIEPIETIAALKADPALAQLRTLGFVSHVDTSVINAARAAGADEVLARSAFAGQLAHILTSAGKQ